MNNPAILMMPGQPAGYGPVITQQPGVDGPPGYPGYPLPQGVYGVAPSAPLGIGGWPLPSTICPPGLEYLMPLDKIFIDQKIEPFEAVTGFEGRNRYTAVNANGQPLYVLRESSGWMMRACLGTNRRFKIKVYDCTGREAMRIQKPITFIGDEINVYNGNTLLGSIRRVVCSCIPQFEVCNEQGTTLLTISGPFCICGFSSDFTVYGSDGTEIGTIKKQWSGMLRELFTTADVFGVSFPQDLDCKVKALLFAAAILIDFAYFESN